MSDGQAIRLVLLTLMFCAKSSVASESMDWMKGLSIDAIATSHQKFTNNPNFEFNTRVLRIYISVKGNIFDYSEIYGNKLLGKDQTGSQFGDASQKHVVGFLQKWKMGNVEQEWRFAETGLIRRRIYPWGEQDYYINIDRKTLTCSVRSEIRSSRPDNKFFFYAFKDGEPIEVEKYEPSSSDCKVYAKNIFEN